MIGETNRDRRAGTRPGIRLGFAFRQTSEGLVEVDRALNDLRVVTHPDKTLIGRIARGFDFLGYWFSATGLSIARKTVERMVEKVLRLYEQDATNKLH